MINLIKKVMAFGFLLFTKRHHTRFLKSLKNPKEAQLRLKKDLETEYLKSGRYKKNPIPFKDLMVQDYNEVVDGYYLEEVCPSPIMTTVTTSGSSGVKKVIPYSKGLLNSFRSMFLLWAHDILKYCTFNSFKFYFAISPQFSDTGDGLEDDSEYLGEGLSFLLKPFFVQLDGVKKIKDSDEFLMSLGLRLVSERDLEIISIWSPTFLLSLIDYIQRNESSFLSHLSKGVYKNITFKAINLSSTSSEELFPSLKFVSAWGSASAKRSFDQLRKRFPDTVILQKKGLLATEAPMTIPFMGYEGGVPLIHDVYFEFLCQEGKILYLDELKEEQEYELIISQKGGLYRYPMKDLVKVVGFIEKTPLLEFLGRSSQVSDLVGEKLHESEVYQALTENAVSLIASPKKQCYYLLVEESFNENEVERIERSLCQNPHYLNARKLQQLPSLKIVKSEHPQKVLKEFHVQTLGINGGDVKDSVLIYRSGDELLKRLLPEEDSV